MEPNSQFFAFDNREFSYEYDFNQYLYDDNNLESSDEFVEIIVPSGPSVPNEVSLPTEISVPNEVSVQTEISVPTEVLVVPELKNLSL